MISDCQLSIINYQLDNIQAAAQEFVEAMGERKVFAFYGKMGAGKTTFIKAICEALDVEDVVTSPTFAIVNEYKAPRGSVYHFDFYRIKNLREAYDIGCEEYFYSGQPCFIEWPELIEELLPEDAVRVNIEVHDDGSRTIRLD
jgi:tRNA threonylcarbamoyladenosine biosynthesis protein TsaE